MAVFFSQIGYKPTREWKEEVRLLGSAVQPVRAAAANGVPGQASDQPTAKPPQGRAGPPTPVRRPQTAVFPDGTKVQLPADRDPREVFADWLITPKNPWFTRNIVNRVWSWLLGRGIIHEPDDIRDGQPAEQSRAAGLPGEGIGRRAATI